MRQYFFLLLVLSVLITAGCVEEYTPETTVTTAPALVTTPVLASTPTPTSIPTPAPEQMAYLANIKCGTGDKWGKDYHCNGDVRIRSGPSCEVLVIARYPDNNTFKSNVVEIGGENALSKPFAIFPDLIYQGQNPDYFVKVDKTLYPVIWGGNMGVAWSNTPGAEGVDSRG
jgi:hypothetical protein